MKFFINNYSNNFDLNSFINKIKAFSVKEKFDTFTLIEKCNIYNIDELKNIGHIIINIDNSCDIDNLKSWINIYDEYRFNNLIIFYNKLKIDIDTFDFIENKIIIKSYSSYDELKLFLVMYIIISTNSYKYSTSGIINKIIKSDSLNINIDNITFINDKIYIKNVAQILKKYIKSNISMQELNYINGHINYLLNDLNERNKTKKIIKCNDKIIEKLSKEQNKILLDSTKKHNLDEYMSICNKRINLHKEMLFYDKKKSYIGLAYDYFFLTLFYQEINDDSNLYYYLNIAYTYLDIYYNLTKDYYQYLFGYLTFVTIHISNNIDYVKMLSDLNRIKIIEYKEENYYLNYMLLTQYSLLSFLNYKLKEENKANYYLNMARKYKGLNIDINTPYDALYYSSSLIKILSSVCSNRLMVMFINELEKEQIENIDYFKLSATSVQISEELLNMKQYEEALIYIDKANIYFEMIDRKIDDQIFLLNMTKSLITSHIFYKLNMEQDDIDFHLEIVLDGINKHKEQTNSDILPCILYTKMLFVLDYIKIAKNKDLIKRYVELFDYLENIFNSSYNENNESIFN